MNREYFVSYATQQPAQMKSAAPSRQKFHAATPRDLAALVVLFSVRSGARLAFYILRWWIRRGRDHAATRAVACYLVHAEKRGTSPVDSTRGSRPSPNRTSVPGNLDRPTSGLQTDIRASPNHPMKSGPVVSPCRIAMKIAGGAGIPRATAVKMLPLANVLRFPATGRRENT